MNLKIEIWQVVVGVVVFGLLSISWNQISRWNNSSSKENACVRRCDEFKSKVIDGACHCSSDYGWLEAGKVQWVINKVKGKK